jgi:dsDNA-specific endonuclease/ATPase MutS2
MSSSLISISEVGFRQVIVTTHYQRIKELAAENENFQIAAMEFVDNRPTYRLRMGSIGESFALEAARRMQLPDHVLVRANSLLDNESKRLLALQQRLEEETEKARLRQEELDRTNEEMQQKSEEMEVERQELKNQIQMVKDGKIDDFLDDIREREKELEVLIRKAQSLVEAPSTDMLQADTRSKDRQLEDIKSAVKKIRLETEKTVVETAAEDIATPLVPGNQFHKSVYLCFVASKIISRINSTNKIHTGEPIEEGRTLIILDKGNLFGSRAIVAKRNKGTGKIVLRVAGAEV